MHDKSVAIVLANGIHGRGGIERIMLYLFRQIGEDAPDLPLIVQNSRWDLPGPFKHLSAPFGLVQFAWRVWRHRVGVAHINVAPRASTFRKMAFAAVARSMGARIVLHLHGSGYDAFLARLPDWTSTRVAHFFRNADEVIVLGSFWQDFALKTLQIQPERLSVIGNGVAPPEALAQPDHEIPTIAFMGAVGERKGVDILLDALEILRDRGVAFKAILGGNGEVARFQTMTQAKGLNQMVEFLGWVDEAIVSRTLTLSDMFVLPSRAENQPVAILEAMARGLPVVATRIGAIPEQVVDGVTGIIVAPADALALANALERLCRDRELRVSMGQAGHARWREHYSVRAAAARMIDLYRRNLDPAATDRRP